DLAETIGGTLDQLRQADATAVDQLVGLLAELLEQLVAFQAEPLQVGLEAVALPQEGFLGLLLLLDRLLPQLVDMLAELVRLLHDNLPALGRPLCPIGHVGAHVLPTRLHLARTSSSGAARCQRRPATCCCRPPLRFLASSATAR